MGWTVLYIAFGIVALWLLGEVLLQYKARLRWRLLAFAGFSCVVLGVLTSLVIVIALGAVAFAVGQTFVTLSFRRGFSTGWAVGGRPGASRRRRTPGATEQEPILEVSGLQEETPHLPEAPEAPPVYATVEPMPDDTGQYGVYDDGPAKPATDPAGYETPYAGQESGYAPQDPYAAAQSGYDYDYAPRVTATTPARASTPATPTRTPLLPGTARPPRAATATGTTSSHTSRDRTPTATRRRRTARPATPTPRPAASGSPSSATGRAPTTPGTAPTTPRASRHSSSRTAPTRRSRATTSGRGRVTAGSRRSSLRRRGKARRTTAASSTATDAADATGRRRRRVPLRSSR